MRKPRERKRAGGRQRGKDENRKEKSPSSSSKEAWPISLLVSCYLHPSLPPFLHTLTSSIHLFSATRIRPSFLPSFNIVTNHLHLLRVCIHSSRLPFSPPFLPPCFILLAGNTRSEGQWLTLLPAMPLLICVRGCEWIREKTNLVCVCMSNRLLQPSILPWWIDDDLHISGRTGYKRFDIALTACQSVFNPSRWSRRQTLAEPYFQIILGYLCFIYIKKK